MLQSAIIFKTEKTDNKINTMLDPLRQELFNSNKHAFAIVDAANCTAIKNFFTLGKCLLGSDPEIMTVAPHYFHLEEHSKFVDWLLDEQWGQQNFILFTSDHDPNKVQQHMQNMLYVYDADNKPLFFRYYDPRVLSQFLISCNQEQTDSMFLEVNKYICESERKDKYQSFNLSNGKLLRLENAIM